MNSKEKEIRTISDETGEAVTTTYDLFPGVQLTYQEIQMAQFDVGAVAQGDLIEIIHCREGRIEQEFEDEFFYLMPGDLSIAIRSETVKEFAFPLGHYSGITILIDTKTAPQCFSAFLDDVRVQPMEVARRLCGARYSRVLRAEPFVERIFSEMYSVPEHIRTSYLKVKILELLLVLGGVTPQRDERQLCPLSRYQAGLAKQAAAYLLEHTDRHVTIVELARRFNVSDTYLKTAFNGVYGMPIFTYMRMVKMQLAARQLAHTDRAIADIAAEFGYTSGGKFSIAFREVMGELPSEYRNTHGPRPLQE